MPHMESVGYAVTNKDSAVYVKGVWGHEDFVAGGFWVDDFIAWVLVKVLARWRKGWMKKYGITGLGEVNGCWDAGRARLRSKSEYTSCRKHLSTRLSLVSISQTLPPLPRP